ncbi:MAG TPA: translocation/assembly module TamB domain-containing protein, partial [Cyclobacteriaceae bacterium]|nr:translocation/assembly module TamB domain-containing protein [Cyclobacteriaceae bacterium]
MKFAGISTTGKRILRVIGWTFIVFFAALVLLVALIQVPAIQQMIKQKLIASVSDRIKTPVSLEHVSLTIPKKVVLEGIYLEDQKKDTLLSAGKISLDIDLFALLRKRIVLNSVSIHKLKASVNRSDSGRFNFDYIIQAFNDTSKTPENTDQSQWSFALKEIGLNGIRISYKDAVEKNDLQVNFETLAVDMDEFDIEHSRYHVDNFVLAGLEANIIQGNILPSPLPPEGKRADGEAIDFKFNKIDLQGISLKYSRTASAEIALKMQNARLVADNINLIEKTIQLEELTLDNAFMAYHILGGSDPGGHETDIDSGAKTEMNLEWQITLNKIKLRNNSFQYYDFNKEPASSGIDVHHLWISNCNFEAEKLAVRPTDYSVTIDKFDFHERSGFDLKTLHGQLSIREQSADVKDFLLQTNASEIELAGHAEYPSLNNLSADYKGMKINAAVTDSYVGRSDVNFLMPGLFTIPLKLSALADIHINSRLKGELSDLQVDELEISTLDNTILKTHGTIKGLPDFEHATFDINLQKFYTTAGDMKSILPDTLLPSIVSLPEWVELSGNFSGTLNAPSIQLSLNSDLGSAQLHVETKLENSLPVYNGTMNVTEFDLGKLLTNEEMGVLDVESSFSGAGLAADNHKLKFRLDMNRFDFKGYTYRDFVVVGNVEDYRFTGKASMHDPNLSFNFDGDLDYNVTKEKRSWQFDFDLINADLKALHLTDRPLKTRFSLAVDLDNADPNDLNGDLSLYHVAIYNGEKLYKVDSLLFASVHDEAKTVLSLRSDIVEGKFTGSFALIRLPDVLKDYFNTYYLLSDTLSYTTEKSQQFSFDLQIKNTSLLTDVLIPDLKRFVPGDIKGEFNRNEKKLELSIDIDEFEYGNISGENLKFNVTSDRNKLEYLFKSGQVSASVVKIPGIDFKGEVANNTIATELSLYDSLGKARYVVGGAFDRYEDAFKFHLLPNKVVLDYDEWKVPASNFVTIGESGILSQDFHLTNGNQRIELKTQQGERQETRLSFHQIQLATLAHTILSQDTLINGVIQGDVLFYQVNDDRLLRTDISINDVSLAENKLGDLSIEANQPASDKYNFNVTVNGPATDVDAKGAYSIYDSSATAKVEVAISSLDLSAIEPLLLGQTRALKGNLRGKFSLSGKTTEPIIEGKLTFQETSLIPTYINTKIRLENESVSFTQKEFVLTDFEIKDEKGNPLTLNGRIGIGSKKDYPLDLTARAKNFLLLNTKEGANDLFYGKLIVDADVSVKGTMSHPDLDVQLAVGDNSDVTYIVPQDDKGVIAQRGVVKFVDRDVHEDLFLAAVERDAPTKEDSIVTIQGITLTARIEMNDKEKLTILIDPLTGDKLSVRGNSTLTLDIDETGDLNLTGRYELTSGSYDITFYKLVNRDFEIQKGSTIVWTGDPLNADLDITGIYRVETSPAELLQSQSVTADQQAKQRLPFIVYLNVGGKILTPEISFTLDMAEGTQNALGGSVYAKLRDINSRESDLNKQVFALLILKRFIAENPFDSQGGGSYENTARTSVTRFLSEQLNQMSQNIKGIQLTFDLKSYEDYSSGEANNKTQLQLGVSKNLFSDRLVVKLSGNVDIEGQQGSQDFSDYIGDLALEYKLTEDGRFRVTGFYNSDFDMIDGELKDAGVGLIYIKDYDTLRELF